MEVKSFDQGIHPRYNKALTKDKALIKAKVPDEVVIPLQQHIGAPAKLLVEEGDLVKVGEKIGESAGFVSANIHASVSGEVIAIENSDSRVEVRIKNDGQDNWAKEAKQNRRLEDLTANELRSIIQEAGMVGLGGATFPSHVKVSIPDDKEVDTVILNGAECEPYLTVDHRLMLEEAKKIVTGLKALMKMTEAKKGYIGVEDNKLDAIKKLQDVTKGNSQLKVVPLETKYPQGGEKQLIDAILGKEVPSGGLPLDIGVVVNNTGTAAAMAEAITEGKPLIQRAVTITGAVKQPQNLLVRIGTPVESLIDQCGGFKGNPGKVILGGPMTGKAQSELDVPVTKGTSGVLVLSEKEVNHYPDASPCIRCARCVDACPAKLIPTNIVKLVKEDMISEADDYNISDCIQCGSCTYVCPANIEMVQWIKLGIAKLQAKKRD
ncbi:electron transport complex, RnfABCDGE type, C subunit [Halobacteroides halobius DSM 5150]|uniref:Ion-translocating oxidoreductase complex subunit C n=1 Tax=Halobacteroides halobius (strain ATCC 35273 / DSM 5150 / MD-1) TaxID=748449 RepID=L0KBJ6_HALHC|nr:electron transport complex subunit RsxC [Halobacteroides halobius]AGB41910.1 electron transport complex, RnfABCDGE type, C subunit [Halobacteroides halobius DSM 5150]